MKRKTIKYIAAAMAASMALTACGGSTTSSDSGTTTAAAESASAGSAGVGTTTSASGTDSATSSVADPNASYKDTLNIAVAQQAPSKTIIFWIVPESNTRNAGLESGQCDVIYNLPSDDVERISGLDGVTVYSTQQGTIAPIINYKKGLCANKWFRQAVSYALDYEEVMAATYGTNGYVTGSCYMDEAQPFWYTDAGSEEYNVHDPEKAKEILKENGYDGTPLKLTAATLNKMDYMAVAMQAELEEVGIPVELNIVDWPTLQAQSTDPTAYDMYICTFSQVPIPSLKLYFGPNYAGWNDDETLQSLLNDMNTSTNMDDAKAAWEKVQEYSWDYLAVINFGHYIANYAWNDHVKGLNNYSGLYFWNAGYVE